MLIDLPITILFDAQDTDFRAIARAAARCVWTLRINSEGTEGDILFDHYPPRDGASGEPCDALLANLPSAAWRVIKARAARDPYDYGVGTEEERTAAQEAADREAAGNGADA